MSFCGLIAHFLLMLNDILLRGCTTFGPFTYWGTSHLHPSFGSEMNKATNICVRGFVRTQFSTPLGKCQGERLLYQMVWVCLVLEETVKLFFRSGCTIIHLQQQCEFLLFRDFVSIWLNWGPQSLSNLLKVTQTGRGGPGFKHSQSNSRTCLMKF